MAVTQFATEGIVTITFLKSTESAVGDTGVRKKDSFTKLSVTNTHLSIYIQVEI